MTVKGKNCEYEIVIGLEIHSQIKTNKKLFSQAKTQFGSEQNTQVSFVDMAFPGMLPVLNMACVKQAIKAGLGIKGNIEKYSVFDRKQYFYPDSPQGYQITQLYHPIVTGGEIEVLKEDGEKKTIRVNRIHIEQDAGKLIHDRHPSKSSIDLNRVGVGLMEIVSEPDISNAHEACEYVKNLRAILKEVDASDADMEKGSFRCDVNVSIMPVGSKNFGNRCEIKNLNSIRSIKNAINYEVQRHIEIVESGNVVKQETRLYDTVNDKTIFMRSKEDAYDYRYFPDPDLLPLRLTDEYIDEIRKNMPELPDAKKERYKAEYNLSDYDAIIISSDKNSSQFFDDVVKNGIDPKIACNWIVVELFGRLKKENIEFAECKITANNMSELLQMIKDGRISGKIAKDILDEMLLENKSPEKIVEEKGLMQISDEGEIEKIAQKIVDSNQDKVEAYKSGKDRLFGFFVGQVMKETQGTANPAIVNKILKRLIGQ